MSFHRDLIGDELHHSKIDGVEGTPLGVETPLFIGQMLVDTLTKTIYRASGLTINDWGLYGGAGDISALNELTDVNPVGLVDGDFLIWDNGTEKYIPKSGRPENIITVAKSGGDFTSVKDAMDSITDSDSLNRYVLLVASGVYEENNPIEGKEYVTVKAIGDLQTTRISALNPNSDLMTMPNFFTLEGFTLWGVTGASNYLLKQTVAGLTSISRCIFAESSNGVLINHANAQLTVNDCAAYNLTISTDKGICCLAGDVNINTLTAATGDITTLLEVSGANASTTANNVRSSIPTLTTGISIGDLAQVDIVGAKLLNMDTGIEVDGGAHVHMSSVRIKDAVVDGVRINDVGTGTILSVLASVVEDSGQYDFNLLSPTCTVSGAATTSINKLNFVTGARMYGSVLDLTEDDEGLNVIGELHVGLPELGTESVFGEGDSYTRGMMVYTENTSGTFVDITAEAASPSASTFSFAGTDVENAIYIASSLENASGKLNHSGIKTSVITPKDGGTIVLEYWNGSTWTETSGMEVQADGSHWPHATDYFQGAGSYQLRYSSELVVDGWSLSDPMGLGTNYYWARLRVTSILTTAPVFQQFKLHTNRTEINGDGWNEYFGKARPIGQLPINLSTAKAIEGIMGSQPIYTSENLGTGFTSNEFTTTSQIIGVNGFLPFDADTSSPLQLQWAGRATDTDTIEFTVRWGYTSQGSDYFLAEPAIQPNAKVDTVSKAVTLGQMEIFNIDLDISNMISRREGGFGDELWVSLQATTLSGNFALSSSQVLYTKWCEGGHI